jgi:hypothetical protein
MSASSPSLKVLACRFDENQLAQLSAVARLEGVPQVEIVRDAVQEYMERRAKDGSLKAKADSALAEIDREAAERRQAIQGLLGGSTPGSKPRAQEK